MDPTDDFVRFPLTGRFLAGRLRHDMSEAEKQKLESLVTETRTLIDGELLVRRGDPCVNTTMLIDGFMLRTLENSERRHAVSFHVPGDFVDLHSFPLGRLDHNIECVGAARVGFVPHALIQEIVNEHPHLARLFWFSTLLDAAMHREWIMTLGQLPVPKRIAHVFAEIWARLDMVGRAFVDGFQTPLRQIDIADMCGATPVHVNRALMQLRKDGIADFRRGEVRVANRAMLESFAEFDPTYLYGSHAEAPVTLRQATR